MNATTNTLSEIAAADLRPLNPRLETYDWDAVANLNS